jgi:asparagine synthetase B (glutamine-hydrolysing)
MTWGFFGRFVSSSPVATVEVFRSEVGSAADCRTFCERAAASFLVQEVLPGPRPCERRPLDDAPPLAFAGEAVERGRGTSLTDIYERLERGTPAQLCRRWDSDNALSYFSMRRDELYLYRSPLSLRSVYYVAGKYHLSFSTDPSRLFAGRRPTAAQINLNGLRPRLRNKPPDLAQLFTPAIREIEPGFLLRCTRDGHIRVERIDRLTMLPGRPERSLQAAAEQTRELLRESVVRRCTDPGTRQTILLSGGLDSAALAYEMRAAGSRVDAVHFGWITGPDDQGDHRAAERVTAAVDLPRTDVDLSREPSFPTVDRVVRLRHHMALPFTYSQLVMLGVVLERAGLAPGSQLVGGHGGDESFQGGYRAPRVRDFSVRRGWASLGLGRSWFVLPPALPAVPALVRAAWGVSRAPSFLGKLQEFESETDLGPRSDAAEETDWAGHGLGFTTVDVGLQSIGADPNWISLAPALGLRLTLPFYDRSLLEYARSLPRSVRARSMGGRFFTKLPLRVAYRERLPWETVFRDYNETLLPRQMAFVERWSRLRRLFTSQARPLLVYDTGLVSRQKIVDLFANPLLLLARIRFLYEILALEAWLRLVEDHTGATVEELCDSIGGDTAGHPGAVGQA